MSTEQNEKKLHSKRSIWLAIGVIFHLIYLWSIFDIYFVSPLVHGMNQHQSTLNAPAKRLFLIVGDGQRADKTLGKIYHPGSRKEEYLAPFLRSIILNEGTYGLSHTRMPTESRPGHVAMIAGFYEDVSAVTKGWKENPVDFDSVFNQSSHTYSFGSPDILPMFAQGATTGQVDTWMYGHEFEDFTSSSIELDKYVFNHFYQLLNNSTNNQQLNNQIRQDGNIFFLHLLGTDTSGHSYRPYSEEYYDNIKYTDKEIEKLVIEVGKFFGDNDTAFIFTADHGMSDFGSHGDGHPNNTRTPLICWGKGCNKPVKIDPKDNEFLNDKFENEDMSNWDLDNIKRHDVKQADIASLMSYLIGSNYPMNSVGELPIEFIDDSEINKIKGLYQNSLTLLEQYIVKLHEVKENQFNFKEFNKFEIKSIDNYMKDIEKVIELMNNNIDLESEAILLIEEFNSIILEGLDYLQKYNWLMIRSIVTLGFIGWIVYSFTIFLQMFIIPKDKLSIDINSKHYIQKFIFGSITAIMVFIFQYEKLPLNYYFYLIFPIFLWFEIFKFRIDLINGFNLFFKGLNINKKILIFIFIIIFFESIAIGFENRNIFTYIYLILSFTYPILLFKNTIFSTKKHILISLSWFTTCILLSLFPIQDPVKVESINMIVTSGLIMTIIGIIGFTFLQDKMTKIQKSIIIFQILLIILSIYSTLKAVVSLTNRNGLPLDAQIIGWSVLIISLIFPTILHSINSNSNYKIRFLIIFLTMAPTFNILTISFEGLFYILYSIMIFQWIEIESMSIKSNNNLKLLRISIIGFFNLQIAFFGTGNISSISSFSLDSVYRLLPIFDPFPMGALLMLKLIIPYALLSTGLGLINLRLGFQKYSITSLIISVCDLLSLWFFYMVKTEGSWLDIGVSISNYCLAIFGALFIAIVEVGSTIVLNGVHIEDVNIEEKKSKAILNLKIEDNNYKDIEKIINEDQLDDGSIGSRLKRRNQKIENVD
ncbi:Glycosyl phosphatidyl inositol anchor synthesis [Pichia californica]|uniref:GPI ethanolamine phosphate transferase 1 n=1 Tax=Pichia californica TaxID=460514 RepID=A0A9P7BDY2_9ASCO|nr:Glycosyl phosphatidyl inositol anchor synthesis [[Candida] californica]